MASSCKLQKAECWKCKKQGHVARACKSQGPTSSAKVRPTHQVSAGGLSHADVAESRDLDSDSEQLYSVHVAGQKEQAKPLAVVVNINCKQVRNEIDTRASVSLISEQTFQKLWSRNAPGLRRPRSSPASHLLGRAT